MTEFQNNGNWNENTLMYPQPLPSKQYEKHVVTQSFTGTYIYIRKS